MMRVPCVMSQCGGQIMLWNCDNRLVLVLKLEKYGESAKLPTVKQ